MLIHTLSFFSPHLILMTAQRFIPAAEFRVWSLPGPVASQPPSALWRIHIAWGVSTSLSPQEHRPCSKLQRSTNPLCSILWLLVNKNQIQQMHWNWKLYFSLRLKLLLLWNLTAVILIRTVPAVIAVIAQVVSHHTSTVVAPEQVVGTHWLRLCEGTQRFAKLSLYRYAEI